MPDRKLWQLRVFAGEQALGNATGVVRVDAGDLPEMMADWARLLGYPDTSFVSFPQQDLRLCSDPAIRIDSFSPFEELRLCVQTLLATEAVLRNTDALAGDTPLLAATGAGRIRVVRYTDEPDIAYVELPDNGISIRSVRREVPRVGRLCETEPLVVDTGRARVYCGLSLDLLETVMIPPAEVRSFCAKEGVTGICLTARCPDGTVRLRVFTTSLDGAEDAATGGAAAGVPLYWDRIGAPHEALALLVRQGYGSPQTRGDLRVRQLTKGGVAVGGRVLPVAVGQLTCR